jgi:hypothetical protein
MGFLSKVEFKRNAYLDPCFLPPLMQGLYSVFFCQFEFIHILDGVQFSSLTNLNFVS